MSSKVKYLNPLKWIIRVALLGVMVVLGFTIMFPEWLDFKDLLLQEKPKTRTTSGEVDQKRLIEIFKSKPRLPDITRLRVADRALLSCLDQHRPRDIRHIKKLVCTGMGIQYLTGIEQMHQLQFLDLSDNRLNSLELSMLHNLSELRAADNEIVTVSLPQTLRHLDLSNNQLHALSLQGFNRLSRVNVRDNALMEVRIEAPELQWLDLANNQIQDFSMAKVKPNVRVDLSNNALQSFDFGPLSEVRWLDLRHNKIRRIDALSQSKARAVFLAHNPIARMPLMSSDNKSYSRIVYSDEQLQHFKDPVLRDCVALATVQTPPHELTSLNCSSVQGMHGNQKIRDTEGLATLPALRYLFLKSNQIERIDLSPLPQLTHLNLSNNRLNSLDLSFNPNLLEVRADHNILEHVRLNNPKLKTLALENNQLTEIDLNPAHNLRNVNLSKNRLSNVQLDAVTKLRFLEIKDNSLSQLDVSTAPYLLGFQAHDNPWSDETLQTLRARFWPQHKPLSNLEVMRKPIVATWPTVDKSDVPDNGLRTCIEALLRSDDLNAMDEITELECRGPRIGSVTGIAHLNQLQALRLINTRVQFLDISSLPRLLKLTLLRNPVKKLDLSANQLMRSLVLEDNAIEEIIFPTHSELNNMRLRQNALQSLRLPDMPELEYLEANENQISLFEIGQADQLHTIQLNKNNLQMINLKTAPNIQKLWLNNNALTEIDFQPLTKLRWVHLNNNRLQVIHWGNVSDIEILRVSHNPLSLPDLSAFESLQRLSIDVFQYQNIPALLRQQMFDAPVPLSDQEISLKTKSSSAGHTQLNE